MSHKQHAMPQPAVSCHIKDVQQRVVSHDECDMSQAVVSQTGHEIPQSDVSHSGHMSKPAVSKPTDAMIRCHTNGHGTSNPIVSHKGHDMPQPAAIHLI